MVKNKKEPSLLFVMIFSTILLISVGIFLVWFHGICFDPKPDPSDQSDKEVKWLKTQLQYVIDTRTNMCFATSTVDTLTSVPCTPEVLKLAKQIK